jgi:hypothetical protein
MKAATTARMSQPIVGPALCAMVRQESSGVCRASPQWRQVSVSAIARLSQMSGCVDATSRVPGCSVCPKNAAVVARRRASAFSAGVLPMLGEGQRAWLGEALARSTLVTPGLSCCEPLVASVDSGHTAELDGSGAERG